MPDSIERTLDALIHTTLAASSVGQVLVGLAFVDALNALVPKAIP